VSSVSSSLLLGDGRQWWNDEETIFECWCGASGTYEQLFDDSTLRDTCGGQGYYECLCGGDFCICHNHGQAECYGCPDCEDDSDDDYPDFDEEDDR
jgi:hypothetical protein